jgi:hypothetical protein
MRYFSPAVFKPGFSFRVTAASKPSPRKNSRSMTSVDGPARRSLTWARVGRQHHAISRLIAGHPSQKRADARRPLSQEVSMDEKPSVYLRSRHHEPSQLAGGPFFCRSSIRFTNVIEGPSPGTAARPALKAARASSQHPARYAVSPSA